MKSALQYFYFDLKAVLLEKKRWVHSMLFFFIFVTLFGFAFGHDFALLAQMSGGIIWVGFLLTALFTIETLFRAEQDEGRWAQLLLSPYPISWLMLSKSWALWMVACLPLIIMSPLLGCIFQWSVLQTSHLVLSLLLGSPALVFLGVLGSSMTVALPRSGIFLELLLLPLLVPILILGQSATTQILENQFPRFQCLLLAALSILAITLGPISAGAALKASMDE